MSLSLFAARVRVHVLLPPWRLETGRFHFHSPPCTQLLTLVSICVRDRVELPNFTIFVLCVLSCPDLLFIPLVVLSLTLQICLPPQQQQQSPARAPFLFTY
jgi:hypothetical protein